MESVINDLLPIQAPKKPESYDVLFGVPIPPIERLRIISADQFEDMILEWVDGYLKNQYSLVYRSGGAGDMGRDIVAIVNSDPSNYIWDNYQCKHYEHPLHPSDIWLELGKLCYYTFSQSYTVPRKYYFISSQGLGPALSGLLEEPSRLKTGLISVWDEKCRKKITSRFEIELTDELLSYIENFDFSIITHCPPQKLIEQYSTTPFYKYRFGGGLVKPRPQAELPQDSIQPEEVRYVSQLYEAYSDHLGQQISDIDELKKHSKLYGHFNRQREDYYKAESLRRFARDELPYDEPFEKLQDEIYRGVVDTAEDDHPDGYVCVKETIKEAKKLQITSNILIKYIDGSDRSGICHQLANKDILNWVKK
ncbi:ABC-three component system protein [Robertmurraya sp. FSL W8-0741]|uniref:ABC-three component system protein n=1 Tax=Robertmurraya sp. FSL W8-0741 TaxID=2954629 RepID=UPI0030F7E26A